MTAGNGASGRALGAVARRGSARRGLFTEGPRWDADRAELLWVDILCGYVLAATAGLWHADDDGGRRQLVQPEAGHADVRMNDGI